MEKILKSRTVWTIVIMFVIGGIQAVESVMPTGLFMFVNAGLSYLAVHFKMNPSQDYKE